MARRTVLTSLQRAALFCVPDAPTVDIHESEVELSLDDVVLGDLPPGQR